MLKDENWYWCEQCDCIAYKYECCGLGSCSGGGCAICAPLHIVVQQAILFGHHPHPILPPMFDGDF